MPRIDSEKFYTSAIEMHGISAQGVNWSSKETQTIRFRIILDILNKNLSKFSIVDAGCGFGDFYNYLVKKKKKPKKYIGIDSLVDMYSIASQKTGCEILIADITKDKLPKADFYVCSGAMNVLNKFETHLFMRNCYDSCTKAFVFNILHGKKESDTYNYLSTLDIKNIANKLGVNKIIFKDNYLDGDITVGFFK